MNYDDFDIARSRKLIDEAELTVEEVIPLLPITKQTYYNWLKGRPVRDQLRFRLTAVRFALLEKALRQKLLPFPAHTPKAKRPELLIGVMKAVKN